MKKDWTGNKKSVFTTLGASNHVAHDRAEHDYYATDPIAIDKLFDVLGVGSIVFNYEFKKIWEPACGEGHLSKRMKELVPNVSIKNSDIVNRGFDCEIIDFLKYNSPNSFDGDIITNPPYRYAQEFVEKAIETITPNNHVCMFLKLTFLEGQKRNMFFRLHRPENVCVFSKRVKCAMNGDFDKTGSSATAYAWFIWRKIDRYIDTCIRWI